jgi:hypothetical protein
LVKKRRMKRGRKEIATKEKRSDVACQGLGFRV